MFNRKKNNVSTSDAFATVRNGVYSLSFGITRYTGLDYHDFNRLVRENKIHRDSITWGTPDKALEDLYYASR